MTISVVQSKNGGGAGAESFNVVLDSAPVQGNLLVLCGMTDNDRAHTTPGGWTLANSTVATGGPEASLYYKIAGASESATVTFSFTGGVDIARMAVVEVSGVDAASPLEASATAVDNGLVTTHVTGAVTTAGGAYLCAFVGHSLAVSTPSFNNSYSVRESAITADIRGILGDRIVTTGVTGQTTTLSWTNGSRAASVHAAFKEAGGGGGPALKTRKLLLGVGV